VGAGDWLANFLDLSISELEKSVKEILPHRLDALLDIAIRASSASSDSFKDNLRIKLVIGQQAETGADVLGIRAMTLEPKKIPSPMDILFSPSVIGKYQAIFRNLVYGRWVDRKLGEVWLEFQKNATSAERGSTALLSRMFHFCKNFVFFCAAAADARFHEFLEISRNSENFEEIRDRHEKCLDGICADLLLTADSAALLRSVSKILSTCALFASHLRRFLQLQTQKNFSKEEKFLVLIGKFSETFGSQTRAFLKNLEKLKNENADPRFSALLARLDFNDFFSN
jgi:gamma-tubulin complex component 2